MPAFAFAADHQADGVELDVRLCASGEVVVFHDMELTRMAGGDPRLVIDVPWSDLRRANLGNGTHAPLLSEALDFAQQRGFRVNVEIKRDLRPERTQTLREEWRERMGLVRAVAPLVRGRAQVCLSSFDPVMLIAAGRLVPEIPRCMLFHEGQARYLPWNLTALGPFQGFNAEHTMISHYGVEFAHRRGAVVTAWTVNANEDVARLAACGTDGIITDRPDLHREPATSAEKHYTTVAGS